MGWSRTDEWAAPRETYSEDHIRNILTHIGIETDSETRTNFLCFCPFHDNTDSPAFSVDKATGRFLCFNYACNAHGNLYALIRGLTKKNDSEIARFIIKTKVGRTETARQQIERIKEHARFPDMPRELLERMQHDFWESQRAIDYMTKTRGFEEDTLRYFGIGYSPTRDMVATPMFDIKGNPIGIIGRSIEGKQFNNSKDLPRGRTLWNIHNAKKHSTAIVMEANFDGMRVHESGYPGVVGILGGHFSDEHADQLARHFERIIIMTDNDDPSEHNYDNPEKGVKCRKCAVLGLDACKGHNPGRELGERVAEEMTARSKPVLWAMYSEEVIYPAKDAAAMTKEQVRACIENAVPNYRYHQLDASVV